MDPDLDTFDALTTTLYTRVDDVLIAHTIRNGRLSVPLWA